jgi:hypothetical protein
MDALVLGICIAKSLHAVTPFLVEDFRRTLAESK